MKKHYLVLPFVTLLLFPFILYADEEDRKHPPEGMEIKKVGDAKFLVPIGGRIHKEGDLNIVESITEFSSRKFLQIQKQFENIETKLDTLANGTKEDFKRHHSNEEEIEKALIQMKKEMVELQIKQADIEKTLKRIMDDMLEIKEDMNKK